MLSVQEAAPGQQQLTPDESKSNLQHPTGSAQQHWDEKYQNPVNAGSWSSVQRVWAHRN